MTLMQTVTENSEFVRKRPREMLLAALLVVAGAILGCSHDAILQRVPPNPNGHWHGYIDCGGQLGDFGFTIDVDAAGAVSGTGGEACHLSTATFTVTGDFRDPDMSLTMTWTGRTDSFQFLGTLQADTIFTSSTGLTKLVRVSQ
jgi:hypothetical protein